MVPASPAETLLMHQQVLLLMQAPGLVPQQLRLVLPDVLDQKLQHIQLQQPLQLEHRCLHPAQLLFVARVQVLLLIQQQLQLIPV